MNAEELQSELQALQSKLDDPSYYSSKEYPKTAKRIERLKRS